MVVRSQYQQVAAFILFVLALLLLFNLVKPMISVLLGGILLAYICFPLYARLNKKWRRKRLSIIAAMLIVILIILIPFSFLAFGATQQGVYFYNSLSSGIAKGAVLGFGCVSEESKVCSILNQMERFSAEHLSEMGFDKQLQKLSVVAQDALSNFILSIPLILAEVFLAIVITFFILKDWEAILKSIVDLLPMRKKTTDRLVAEFDNIAHTVIYAQLFVAGVQGVVGIIGFYLFGVPFPMLFGVLLAFCALIPTIGTAIVWLPASVLLMVGGYFSHDYWTLAKGIGLFFYGFFIISTIDNVLLSTIVHAKTKVNQIVVIVGVIGGAAMFGFVGIFVGPILLSLLMTYFETFKERFDLANEPVEK